MIGVPWRRVAMVFAVVALALSGVFVALRADGFDAIDATVPRATRWFVDNDSQVLVLADGFAGKALAKIPLDTESNRLEVVQGPSGASLLDRSDAATSQTIDTAALRVGSAQALSLIAAPDTVVGVGQSGVIAVSPDDTEGVLLPPEGEPLPFDVGVTGADDDTRISSDGAVWTIAEGSFARITTTGREVFATGLGSARFSLVGNTPLLLDAGRSRVRFGDGAWVALPVDVPVSEVVVQEPGPPGPCGWVGGNDRLWCVGTDGFDEQVDIEGLDIDGSDLLAIAGDAGAVVRPASAEIVPLDWRAGRVLDASVEDEEDAAPTLPDAEAGTDFSVASSVDLVWVEDVDGDLVWAINPWGIEIIRKTDAAPLIGPSGEVITDGEAEPTTETGPGVDEDSFEEQEREPDNDGVDDPPVANDDQVTARFGISVPIAVTANDYDPDGDAIAVIEAEHGARGLVSIQSASTVLYAPDPNTVGLDQFTYTITDGAGNRDTATVTVQLLPADAPNTAPVGRPDEVQTRINTSVVVDVLANDIDPERDALQIGSFTVGNRRGTVSETMGPNDQPALQFTPLKNVSGRATFQYRPVDAFGARGKLVNVTIEIAPESAGNRPPIARPDATRVRTNDQATLNVLANDTDPDGDTMIVSITTAVPAGFDVEVDGPKLLITARPGAPSLGKFDYTLSDGSNEPVFGAVLVSVIDEAQPNSPPLANADTATAVVGMTKVIDVLANDSDPDKDPLVITSVSQPDDGTAVGTVRVRGNRIEYVVNRLPSDEAVFDRFSYTITDGQIDSSGQTNVAVGEVTVRVLPEPIDLPPYARADTATTVVDTPVTIDVLRNDGDPSGEAVVLRGAISCAAGGDGVITTSGEVRFTPPAGREGRFACTYEIGNSQGLTAIGEIVITVVPPQIANRSPLVPAKERQVEINGSVSLILLEGVTDVDATAGDPPLEVVRWAQPTIGRAVFDGTTLTYFAPDVETVASLSYEVRDADGGVATGTVVFRIVEPEPQAPVARDDSTSVINDTPGITVTVSVLGNDIDPDLEPGGAPLRVTAARVIGDGGIATFTNTSVTVAVADRYFGRIVVEYTITDAQGLTDTGEVTIDSIKPANRVPVAGDDSAEVTNGSSVTIPIALNDSDPDADPLTFSIVSGASSTLGQARIQDGNTLVFSATPGASGTAIVVYSVSDGTLSDNAMVRITVLACSAALPEAPDVNLFTGYQQPISVDLTQHARNGEIVQVGAPLGAPVGVYTPPAGFNDNVEFTYVVRNACGVEAVGRVVIDVNQDPIAGAINESMGRRNTLSVPVESMATDPNGESLVIQRLDNAPAWVTLATDGRGFTAAPAGTTGVVSFTATVADPGGLTATVPVTISLVNLAPVPAPDQYRADDGALIMDVLANDTDPDGDAVSLQNVPATVTFTNGVTVALEVQPDGRIRIDPGAGVGTAMFDYGIVDAQGLPSVQLARVTIAVNTPPTAPPVDVTIQAGSVLTVTVAATDPDGGPLVITVESDPTPLTIVVNGLDLEISAPVEAANNQYALIYRVTDPLGASSPGTLNITVFPPAG